MIRACTRSFLGAACLLGAALPVTAQPTADARIAADGLGVEFVLANPDAQAYQCGFAYVDVRYAGVSPVVLPAVVEAFSLAPQSQGLVLPQQAAQLQELRATYGADVRAEAIQGAVQLDCRPAAAAATSILALDDRSACGDPRTIATSYTANLKIAKIAVSSAPTPLGTGADQVVASQRLPVAYALHLSDGRRVEAYRVDGDGIAPAGSMPLPPRPSGTGNGGQPAALPYIGSAFLDDSTLLLAYGPSRGAPPFAGEGGPATPMAQPKLYFDLLRVDQASGAPLGVTRAEADLAAVNSPASLFFARSMHEPDAVRLYVAAAPVSNTVYGATPFAEQPTDGFESPHAERMFQLSAVRLDAKRDAQGWRFSLARMATNTPFFGVDYAAHTRDFVASGAHIQPGAATSIRIDALIVAVAGEAGAQRLDVWSKPAQGAAVLSESMAGYCDARLVKLDSRSFTSGQPDLNAQDAAGKTRLHHLMRVGDAQAVAAWLAKEPALDIRDNTRMTPAMMSVKANRGDLLALLLGAGANFDLPVPWYDGLETGPFSFVIASACDTCIAPLRERQLIPQTVRQPNGGETPLPIHLCTTYSYERAVAAQMVMPEEMLANMPPQLREQQRARQEAWLASDPPVHRLKRMLTALNIDCQPPQ